MAAWRPSTDHRASLKKRNIDIPLIRERLYFPDGNFKVRLELHKSGGHMGFIAGPLPWRAKYWLEERVPSYIKTSLLSQSLRG